MDHINRIELLGRVGNVRTNEYNGSKVANLSLVTDVMYKTREGAALESTWLTVVAWEGKETKDIHRVSKGQHIHVVGRMRTTRHTGPDGVEKTYYEVLANRIRIMEEETADQ